MKKIDFNRIIKEITKNKKKFAIQLLAVVSVIIVLVLTINFTVSRANVTDASFLQDKRVDGLLFTRASFNNNRLKVMVKNENASTYTLQTIDVSFYDENGTLIITIPGYVGESIDSNEIKQLVVETDLDLENASRIEYKINK